MVRLSILVGIGLMLVGALGYALPERHSATALIPAVAGIVIALGGVFSNTHPGARRHLMHINALLALVLIVGSSMRLPSAWVNAGVDAVPFIALLDVVALSAIYLYYAILSFIEARRHRNAQAAQASTQASVDEVTKV